MKTKVLIGCMDTVQLICTFVFTYANSRFSHNAALIMGVQNEIYLQSDKTFYHDSYQNRYRENSVYKLLSMERASPGQERRTESLTFSLEMDKGFPKHVMWVP